VVLGCASVTHSGALQSSEEKEEGFTVCSSGYAATDTSWKRMLRTAQLRLSLSWRLNPAVISNGHADNVTCD
jgi:hypothetical protein